MFFSLQIPTVFNSPTIILFLVCPESLRYLFKWSWASELKKQFYTYCRSFSQWWASAVKSLLYFKAQIFCDENKVLIVTGTFYFNGALIFLKRYVQCNMSLVFKSQRNLYFFPENQCFKNKMIVPTLVLVAIFVVLYSCFRFSYRSYRQVSFHIPEKIRL